MITFISAVLHLLYGCVGGAIYFGIEILYRGYSHWSMALLGGVCFVLIGLLDEWQKHPPLLRQMVQGALIVTVLEFVTGCLVNIWLGWDIWDYSELPFNILGQICLYFTLAWFFLTPVAVVLENLLHKLTNYLRRIVSMKDVKNIFLDHAWEIHELAEAEDKALDEGRNVDVGVTIEMAVPMFANNLDDIDLKDDLYKYDGITLDWRGIVNDYGWNKISRAEKDAIIAKHCAAFKMFRTEIGAAWTNGRKEELSRLYADAYAKIG